MSGQVMQGGEALIHEQKREISPITNAWIVHIQTKTRASNLPPARHIWVHCVQGEAEKTRQNVLNCVYKST